MGVHALAQKEGRPRGHYRSVELQLMSFAIIFMRQEALTSEHIVLQDLEEWVLALVTA